MSENGTPANVGSNDGLGLVTRHDAIEVPDAVQEALATLLEVQFMLDSMAHRLGSKGMTPAVCKPAADVLKKTCNTIKQALLNERERCQPNGLMFDALGEPRTRYVRVTLNRSHCVMHPSEGDCYVQDARDSHDPDWERYIVRDVWLSEREFEDLPEHYGF